MADQKGSSDEYEYPSEEYYKIQEETPDEMGEEPIESPSGAPSRSLGKRLFTILAFIGAIIVVYFLLSYTAARRAAELSQPTPVAVQQPVAPTTPTAPPPPVQQPAVIQAVAPPVDPAATTAFQNVVQVTKNNQQAIVDLQNQMQQLQSQLSTLTNSISNLSNQMQVIANELKGNAIDKALQGRTEGLTRTGIAFNLKALVPGRAWLQAKNGVTTTVTIGDRLPGYGIIQMINVEQGIVTTSSGAVIGYGPKDS